MLKIFNNLSTNIILTTVYSMKLREINQNTQIEVVVFQIV